MSSRNDEIKEAIKDSSHDFVNIVWPIVKDRFGGGTIIPVEITTKYEFAKELDMLAGIDAWHILENRMGLRGIASRVQWGRPYNTFTIRIALASGHDTEYQKRLYALNNPDLNLIYPHITCQAYLDKKGGNLLSAAIIKTKDLMSIFNECYNLFKPQKAPGGNMFKAIPWLLFEAMEEQELIEFYSYYQSEEYH